MNESSCGRSHKSSPVSPNLNIWLKAMVLLDVLPYCMVDGCKTTRNHIPEARILNSKIHRI
jgi:hypothetical protein